jgi:hypothetical protein
MIYQDERLIAYIMIRVNKIAYFSIVTNIPSDEWYLKCLAVISGKAKIQEKHVS